MGRLIGEGTSVDCPDIFSQPSHVDRIKVDLAFASAIVHFISSICFRHFCALNVKMISLVSFYISIPLSSSCCV